MKEIIRIHLARTPFAIEIEARKVLEQYLDDIKKALHADDETMREIEARVVEILDERGIKKDGTITVADVEAVTGQLGEPSEFSDDDEAQPGEYSGQKRLMRDSEHGMLGGVCAGIADYFGVNVMWPRLVAILAVLISFGTALIVYAVLWLVIPPAKTAADKLQMRGEPVTLAALKAESSETMAKVIERSKPLVVVLRILLGIGFVLAALGAVGLTIAAVFVREPLFSSSIHGFATGSTLGILGGAYVTAIAAGLLFAVLMALAAYASFTWTVNKKMLVSGGIIVVLGLASFATTLGLGAYGVGQVHQRIAELQTSETSTLAALAHAKNIEIDMSGSLSVNYIATSDTPRVTTDYLKGYEKPVVKVTEHDGTTHITVGGASACQNSARFACLGYESVTIYGPAAANLTAAGGTLNYTADQDAMTLHVKSDAGVVADGSIGTLTATLDEGASLGAQDASIHSVTVALDQSTSADFGTVFDMTATAPESCGMGEGSQLSYAGVTRLTVNGQVEATDGFHTMHTLPFMSCVRIERDE